VEEDPIMIELEKERKKFKVIEEERRRETMEVENIKIQLE